VTTTPPESRSPEPGTAAAPPAAPPPAASPPGGSDAASASRLNQEGERLFASGDYGAAVDRFRRAVQISPGSAHFRNNLGWALFQLRELDEAARQLEEAARQDPRRAIVHANLGEVRWAQGDRAGAIAAYERFLQLNTNPRQRRIAEERLREMRASEPGTDA
jgi:Flp pilus assembly protein TadD